MIPATTKKESSHIVPSVSPGERKVIDARLKPTLRVRTVSKTSNIASRSGSATGRFRSGELFFDHVPVGSGDDEGTACLSRVFTG